jgi:CelD/BcsL family acetyltransferase involved in cellulose biosynthesis
MREPNKKADRDAVKLLAKYEKVRADYRRLEQELDQAAIEFGWRRGHIGFTRVETMRVIMEREGLIK